MTLPNFLIIGAKKCGTTSLYHYLNSHPDIYMPSIKETRYFAFDPGRESHRRDRKRAFPIRTLKEYERLFERASTESAIGEVSPQYLRSPVAPENIAKTLSEDVKLIAILRNPVDRAYSEYLMKVRSGNESRPAEWYLSRPEHLEFGRYGEQLERYFRMFPVNNIKVVLTEELRDNAQLVLCELFRFLGVEESIQIDTTKRFNEGGLPRNPLFHRVIQVRNKRIRNVVKPFVPTTLRDMRNKLKRKNMRPAPPLDPDLRARVHEYYADDISRLERLIGRDLGIWRDAVNA